MTRIKNVLVTGSNGYIGSILTTLLKKEGYNVVGLDIGYFDDKECHFKNYTPPKRLIKKDLRNITKKDLKGIDAVCHLAALSNDPMGELNKELTYDINLRASKKLARLAKSSGVKRFLFSSSCSIYGMMGDKTITESSPTDPRTAYAISKVKFEKYLLKKKDKGFSPVILRNATAYGSSPKLRVDLVLNNLSANAFTTGKINILSDGTPWRPVIHAEDIARLFVAFLSAPSKKVSGQAINCGQNKENFQVRDIAGTVKETFRGTKITLAQKPDKDSRTYRVSFDKLEKLLPDFKFKWTLKKAADQLQKDFKKQGLNKNVLKERNFVRLRQLEHLIKAGHVDQDLFWKS